MNNNVDHNETSIIIYNSEDGRARVDLTVVDDTIWLSQKQLAELFATSRNNIAIHITNILKDKELEEDSVSKYFLLTAKDGKNYKVNFYSLEMILAIGYRVRSKRGVQFRTWATHNLKE